MIAWIQRLLSSNRRETVRVRMMMESGELVDERGVIIQNQVILQKAEAAFRMRPTVPLYAQTGEDQLGVWQENILVETGEAEQPGSSSVHNLQDMQDLHIGVRGGTLSPLGGFSLANKHLAWTYLVFSFVALIGAIAFAILKSQEQDVVIIQEVSRDQVVELEGLATPAREAGVPEGAETAGTGGARGTEGDSSVPSESVSSGIGESSGPGTIPLDGDAPDAGATPSDSSGSPG